MKWSLIVLILSCTFVHADHGQMRGVAFDVNLGWGSGSITNPDATNANYKILAVAGGMSMPVIELRNYSTAFFELSYAPALRSCWHLLSRS